MKKIFTFLLFTVIGAGSITAQTAKFQLIHNSPDASLDSIDVYINDSLYSYVTAIKYLDYTSSFLVPSNVPIRLGIAPAHSLHLTDTLFSVSISALTTDSSYVITLAGVSAANIGNYYHSPGVDNTFNAYVHSCKASFHGVINTVNFMVFNGMFDVPAVDIFVRGQGKIINHLGYGEYDSAGYLLVAAHDYIIEVYDTTDTHLLQTFYAPLAKVIGLGGGVSAIVYIAGFADTAHGPGFDMYNDVDALHALVGIAGFPVVKTALAQFIHNAADPALDSVDVYIKTAPDNAVIDSFPGVTFRNASPIITVPSQIPLFIGLAPLHSNSTTPLLDSVVLAGFSNDTTYAVFANGVISTSGFIGNPNNKNIRFNGYQNKLIRTGTSGATDVAFFNGVTDANVFSLVDSASNTIVGNKLFYGSFAGYQGLTAADHHIEVTDTGTGDIRYVYNADFTGLGDSTRVVFASGFVNATGNQPTFELWAATPGGLTYPLSLLFTGIAESSAPKNIALYPNPATSMVRVDYSLEKTSEVQYRVVNMLGQTIKSVDLGNVNSGSNNLKLDVSGYAKGMYMLNLLVGNNNSTTIRFVVE